MENELQLPEITPEQIEKSVKAAFDSVNLINKLNLLEELTQDQIDTKARNIEHLKIMLAKEWFVEALTEEQTTTINQII
jgi:hypothetical protein